MASPLVGIRNLLVQELEKLVPTVEPNKRYRSAGKMHDLPDGASGHRMFAIEGPNGGIENEDGADQAQFEHIFTLTVRLHTQPMSIDTAFEVQSNEPVQLMNFINRLSLATVPGADAIETRGYENEVADNEAEDTDLVISVVAYTQEADS